MATICLTVEQLSQLFPKCSQDKLQQYFPHLIQAILEFEITSVLRMSAFLAQIGHESSEFRWMEEIWGPTPAQKRYEPPSDLAKRLGNTKPGDGKLFKGRGPIQLTGRANYRKYGEKLGLDLENNPPLAAQPDVCFRIAGLYWKDHSLNELADAGDFVAITKKINGGLNGLQERERYYKKALQIIDVTEAGAAVGQ